MTIAEDVFHVFYAVFKTIQFKEYCVMCCHILCYIYCIMSVHNAQGISKEVKICFFLNEEFGLEISKYFNLISFITNCSISFM